MRFILIASTLGWSWLGMMMVHELGHAGAAWMTGGSVERVVVHPLSFSRTELSGNPHPLAVAWAGAAAGVLLPLAAYGIAGLAAVPWRASARFFAGFCLVANGAYLGFGWLYRAGDAADLLRHGASVWQLCLFGAGAMMSGLALWHGLGRQFGLAPGAERVTPFTAAASTTVLAVLAIVAFCFGGQ
jgi:hypothetical protein